MWKIISDTGGRYSANDETGQIRRNAEISTCGYRLKEKILTTHRNSHTSCLCVHMRFNGIQTSRSVAKIMINTFGLTPSEMYVLKYKDGDYTNCRAKNLQCIPYDKYVETTDVLNGVNRQGGITVTQIDPKTNKVLGTYPSMYNAVKTLGITLEGIRRSIADGRPHGGYIWKAVNTTNYTKCMTLQKSRKDESWLTCFQ